MKKKKPTLTHYTKRLKKVRLARTITVIATLFVSGVVVAANVLPQVIKSNASTTTDNTNDVIAGGVNQWNGATAKSELVQKVFVETSDQAQSAKALYAKFGVTQSSIQNAKFQWLYGPNASGTKVEPNGPIAPYANWRSFGRTNNVGYTLLQVAYGAKTANFYHKPLQMMFPNTWSSGTSAAPVLMDASAGGPKWFIILNCGNIVVPTIPSETPSINFTKEITTVTRAGKAVDFKAAGFKLQLKDQLNYRISGKNGKITYPAGLRLADGIPEGTKFISQGGDGWPNTTVTAVNPKPVVDGKTYVAWDFGAIPANQGGYTDFKVEVTAVTSQICNFAIWSAGPGKPLQGATNKVCLPTKPQTPLLDITKKAVDAPSAVKVGDQVKYEIVMTNTGDAAATNALALDILKKDSAGKLTQTFASLGSASLKKISDGSDVAATLTPVKDAASQKTYANGNPDAFGYVVSSMPVGTKLTFTIFTKAAILPQACDFAIANYKDSGNAIAVDVSPDVCIPVIDNKKPRAKVTKQAVSPGANSNVARGQVITYDIIVENPSEVAITTPITVKDTFTPPGIAKEIKVVGNSSGVTATVVTDGVNITIPKLAAGAKATTRISAKISDTAADNTKFCNNATITTNIPGNVPTEVTSTVCHNVSLIKKSKTAKYINRSEDPQKSPANAGDEIQYTLTTTNQASTPAEAYVVTEELADVLKYADLTDNGGGTLTGTKLLWPAKTIPAGGSITNTFKVKVKDPVPNNEPSVGNPDDYDYNMFNNYGNDVNIKINKPLIQQVVDVATDLPQTGAAQYGLVIFFLGLSVYFFVRNKQLTNELAAATVEYQHQESASTMAQAQNLIHPEDDDVTPQPPAAPSAS